MADTRLSGKYRRRRSSSVVDYRLVTLGLEKDNDSDATFESDESDEDLDTLLRDTEGESISSSGEDEEVPDEPDADGIEEQNADSMAEQDNEGMEQSDDRIVEGGDGGLDDGNIASDVEEQAREARDQHRGTNKKRALAKFQRMLPRYKKRRKKIFSGSSSSCTGDDSDGSLAAATNYRPRSRKCSSSSDRGKTSTGH
ncbi:hypothetical protein PHYBOEH_010533 [Phytophthora boehmeriae]|uniref:Uncharacterized protein n=1 Tax=Phytophthora boehmeriae TaxID=109152 RepID=A0A8T1VQQ7_9STRA|nr:hypothetical protein PHYBOEH_010533 [Phytophthora boehmeriae]